MLYLGDKPRARIDRKVDAADPDRFGARDRFKAGDELCQPFSAEWAIEKEDRAERHIRSELHGITVDYAHSRDAKASGKLT